MKNEKNEAQQDLTLLLQSVSAGEEEAKDQLIASVYEQLRKIAQGQLFRERSDHTLQPTELVHELTSRWRGTLRRGIGRIDRISLRQRPRR